MIILKEKEFQDIIEKNNILRQDICKALNIDFMESVFEREIKFINGITSDFTLFQNGKIRAIFECKGGAINVTDYVRGIGQIFQYEFFAEEKLSDRNYNFYPIDEFYSVYIFPDSVLRLNEFNVALFKYPRTKKLIEVNAKSLAVRIIDDNELKLLKDSKEKNLVVISQYYIRDNRLFELYFLLKLLMLFKLKSKKVHRQTLHKQGGLLRKTNTINNANWRNAFISLTSLGFIDRDNYPTQTGVLYANKAFYEFAYMIFEGYLKPYYEAIFTILSNNPNISNREICEKIRKNFSCKTDILFLTQSNGRYISSWLNIARDDFGILDFEPHQNKRKILLNPCEANAETFKTHIKVHSKYNDFERKFMEVYNEI